MGIGQRLRCLGQHTGDADVGADGAHDGAGLDRHDLVRLLQLGHQFLGGLAVPHQVGDGVGIGGLEDVAHAMLAKHFHQASVKAHGAHHAGVVDLDQRDLVGASHDLDAGALAHEIFGDEGAGVVGLERVLQADRNACQLHRLGGLGVDGLHAHVGQLVGHVVVGGAHHDGVFQTDEVRVGRRQVEFLVDHGLGGAHFHGDLAEGDFRIAAVKLAHDAFGALGVAGGHHHLVAQVQALEAVGNALVNGPGFVVVKTSQIHQHSVDAVGLEDLDRVERAVRFTNRCQHFARCQQHILAAEVAAGQHMVHGVEVFAGLANALVHKGVGHIQRQAQVGVACVELFQAGGQVGQCVLIALAFGKQGVNAALARLFVLQQLVRHARVGRHHVNAAVNPRTVVQHDVAQHIAKGGHGSAADLLDRDLGVLNVLHGQAQESKKVESRGDCAAPGAQWQRTRYFPPVFASAVLMQDQLLGTASAAGANASAATK